MPGAIDDDDMFGREPRDTQAQAPARGRRLGVLEAELYEMLEELPRRMSERPTLPAPPLAVPRLATVAPSPRGEAPTGDRGSIDEESTTSRRYMSSILPPAPPPYHDPAAWIGAPPRHDSIPAMGVSIRPVQPTETRLTLAVTLAEARLINAKLSTLGRGAVVFSMLAVGLLATLAIALYGPAALPSRVAQSADLAPAHAALPSTAAIAEAGRRAKPETIELGLSAFPRTVRFRIDQGPWLPTPHTQSVERDDREHELLAAADGYVPRVVKVRFAKDVLVDVSLQRAPDAAPLAPRFAPSRRTPAILVPSVAPPSAAPTQSAPPPPVAPPPTRPVRRQTLDHDDPWG